MSRRRWQEGACNCVEHHFSQIQTHAKSIYGLQYYVMLRVHTQQDCPMFGHGLLYLAERMFDQRMRSARSCAPAPGLPTLFGGCAKWSRSGIESIVTWRLYLLRAWLHLVYLLLSHGCEDCMDNESLQHAAHVAEVHRSKCVTMYSVLLSRC